MKNEKDIRVENLNPGNYRLTMIIYNSKFSTVSTQSSAVDEYRDADNERRHNRGYKALYRELMSDYRKWIQTRKNLNQK